MPPYEISPSLLDEWRRAPIHEALCDLAHAAFEAECADTREFRKLIVYLLDSADDRDRRESWVTKVGVARPVPKLRILIEDCFGEYADLRWFLLNKVANRSQLALRGLFPRMAASISRVRPEDLGELTAALIEPDPDAAVMQMLHPRRGKIKGLGPGLFSRVAYALRRDQFFLLPRPWADRSGCLKFIGNDLRRYCRLCVTLRELSDELELPEDIRGTVLDHILTAEELPRELRATIDAALGPALARFRVLAPGDAYDLREDARAAAPLEFAATTIMDRRGHRELRNRLCRAYGDRCAITGAGPKDLLEVAYVTPYPAGDVHSHANAILLRADLHTLWDLNLIGVDPRQLRVRASAQLKGSEYEGLEGQRLHQRADNTEVSRRALADRWAAFTQQPVIEMVEEPPMVRATPTPEHHRDDPFPSREQDGRDDEHDARSRSGEFTAAR